MSLMTLLFALLLCAATAFTGTSTNNNRSQAETVSSAAALPAASERELVVSGLRECLDDLSSITRTSSGSDDPTCALVEVVSDEDVESMATFIDDCMSGPARSFHSVKHALDISKGADSIQKIAAYFHDVIYYAIDGGFSDEQATVLGNVVVEDGVWLRRAQCERGLLRWREETPRDHATSGSQATFRCPR